MPSDLISLAEAVPGARVLSRFPDAVENPMLTGLAYDSRQVEEGDLFFCVPGLKTDGLRFLPDAASRGAAAAVVEREEANLPLPALLVPKVRAAMGPLSARF